MNISQRCAEFCVVKDIRVSFTADHFGTICSAETDNAVKEVK
jgi:hypothetical protein